MYVLQVANDSINNLSAAKQARHRLNLSLPKFQSSFISKSRNKVSVGMLTQANGTFVCNLHQVFQLASSCAEGVQNAVFP